LGNFISNQAYNYTLRSPVKDGRQRDSVIMSIELVKKTIIRSNTEIDSRQNVSLRKVTFIPVWTVNKRIGAGSKMRTVIRTYPIYDLLNEIDIEIKSNSLNKQYLEKKKKLLNLRLNDIKNVLFKNGTLENVYFYKPEVSN
jgi:hypothetical protein